MLDSLVFVVRPVRSTKAATMHTSSYTNECRRHCVYFGRTMFVLLLPDTNRGRCDALVLLSLSRSSRRSEPRTKSLQLSSMLSTACHVGGTAISYPNDRMKESENAKRAI